MTARENLISYALVALPNEITSAKCEELADAYRSEVLREAIVHLTALVESESTPDSRKPGLDYAIARLLDLVTGRDETAGGEVR